MADLVSNANPKKNPITTIFGIVFLTIAALLFVAPYFVTIKEPIAWWIPIIPFGLGVLLVFITTDDFKLILTRADKVAAKKTNTD